MTTTKKVWFPLELLRNSGNDVLSSYVRFIHKKVWTGRFALYYK